MAKLDRVLSRYDLGALEAAMVRRRKSELRELAALAKKLRSGSKSAVKKVASGMKRKRRPNARRLNKISLADAIARVMKGRKTAIHYKDLTDAIMKRKLYKTKSKNLLSTVAVTLKRDRRFRKTEAGYYSLR
jgi:hypothetical protein